MHRSTQYKIFLSYSHKDNSLAEEIINELNKAGLTVWRDVEEIFVGELIPIMVSTALSQCHAICILLTSNSLSSEWVKAELSAAFMRWTRDPSFKIFPVIIDRDSVPAILSGMHCIDAQSQQPHDIAERIYRGLSERSYSLPLHTIDWETLLLAIERDQFTEDPSSHRYGGWSKSFSVSFLSLAFPDQVPDTVARVDSISCTQWVIRGLSSLRRILSNSGEAAHLLDRIERLLVLARNYLMRHYDGRGAGLIRRTAEGERIFTDVRHTASFVKAMLQLRFEPIEQVKRAIEFPLLNFGLNDGRLSSYAEVYHLIGLLSVYPELQSPSITRQLIQDLKNLIENRITEMSHDFKIDGDTARLLGHQSQWHMSPYYSWWVLDASGDLLLQSDNLKTKRVVAEVLKGLEKLRVVNKDDSIGFPLSLEGSPDLGATAQIAEVLLRLSPKEYFEIADKVVDFITHRISREFLDRYSHHELLWAVPYFWERYSNIQSLRA
jgi:TIR domain